MTKEEIEAALAARKSAFSAIDRRREWVKYDHEYHVIRFIDLMPTRITRKSEAEERAEAVLLLEKPLTEDPKAEPGKE